MNAATMPGRLARVGAILAFLVLSLSACSGGSGSGSGGESGPVMVTITEQAGHISASSDLVRASTGQKIMFMVTSDAADEIHVHSVPDHEFEVKPGPEQTFTFAVNTPGTIEVESHGLDSIILKLEIS
jgi:plastocyanin